MDPILHSPVVVLLITLLDGAALYSVCRISLGERLSWKDGALFIGIIFLLERLCYPFLSDGYSGLAYLMCFVVTWLQTRFAFHRKGHKLWIGTGICLLAQFGFVLSVAPVCLWIFGAERANAIATSNGWDRLLQSAVNLAMTAPYAALLYAVRRLRAFLPNRLSDFLYLSRAFLLLAGALICVFLLLNQLSPLVNASRLHSVSILLVAMMLLVLVCLSYLIQDFRYLKMRQSNDTLARQKHITDTLITAARQFRHNILNTIYGFEGALLSDNPETSNAYYQQLALKCAMINHENISALHQLDHPQLVKILLDKIQLANKHDVPFYVSIQGTLPRKTALLSRVCQTLALLADGAIAAATTLQGSIHLSLYAYANAVELCLLTTESIEEITTRMAHCLRHRSPSAQPLCISLERQGRYVRQTAVIR